MKQNKEKTDIVVTWVDGNDPKWQMDYKYWIEKETGSVDVRIERYRNWDTLRYWFRGIERFAPWANKIFFVTCGHLPEWLDTSNPKLVVVKHSDYIPAEYLPTFNSNVIEFFMHHMKGLSEQFVYFNDDFFLLRDTPIECFFRNGLPCDIGQMSVNRSRGMLGLSVYRAIDLVNQHFDKYACVNQHKDKWYTLTCPKATIANLIFKGIELFPGFCDHHLMQSFLKSTFDDVWEKCAADLERTCRHRFRSYEDVAFWLFRYWQLAAGQFTPYNLTKDTVRFVSGINDQSIEAIVDSIVNQRGRLLLLNDSSESQDFERNKHMLLTAFDKILPEKSSFEK